MKIEQAKQILSEGKGRICTLSHIHRSEFSGMPCTIHSTNGGWVVIKVSHDRINVRAADLSCDTLTGETR